MRQEIYWLPRGISKNSSRLFWGPARKKKTFVKSSWERFKRSGYMYLHIYEYIYIHTYGSDFATELRSGSDHSKFEGYPSFFRSFQTEEFVEDHIVQKDYHEITGRWLFVAYGIPVPRVFFIGMAIVWFHPVSPFLSHVIARQSRLCSHRKVSKDSFPMFFRHVLPLSQHTVYVFWLQVTQTCQTMSREFQ